MEFKPKIYEARLFVCKPTAAGGCLPYEKGMQVFGRGVAMEWID